VAVIQNVRSDKLYTNQIKPQYIKNISKSAYAQPTLNYRGEYASIKYPMKLTN